MKGKVLTFGIALAMSALGALVAPASWPAGNGSLEVGLSGETVTVPVELGADERIEVVKPMPGADDVALRIALPDGVPIEGRVRAEVAMLRDGRPADADLADLRVMLVLPDGRRELVPPVGYETATGTFRVERRPAHDSRILLGLLGLVIVLWVTEAIPLFVTSLIVPVVVVVTGAGSAHDALAPFFHPIIALFFGGFLMAEAMRRVRLDHWIAVDLVARAGRSPGMLFAALLATSAFLSMWMSNTAATAVLVPIVLAVTAPLESKGYRKACVLGIAFAATAGGVGSLIGTPANPLAAAFLAEVAGRPIDFLHWFAFGLPFVLLFLPVMGLYLWKRSKVDVDPERFADARRSARAERAASGRLDRDQWIVLGVMVLVVGAWLTQRLHGIDTGIVALAGAVLLALLGKVKTDDLQRISWSALLTFGGGLALGQFLGTTGTADWLATRMAGLSAFTPWVGVAVVAAVSLGLTTVASNTASAALLVPLAIPLAAVLGVDPVLLVVVVAIASSIDFALVIGTPPTMIAYSTGLFTTREIFKLGIVLDLVGVILLVTAVLGIWRVLGVV